MVHKILFGESKSTKSFGSAIHWVHDHMQSVLWEWNIWRKMQEIREVLFWRRF